MTTPLEDAYAIVRHDGALDVLREQIAPEATDAELAYLSQVAARYELDAVKGEIILRPQFDKRIGRNVHRPFITAEGRLVIAARQPDYLGYDGPEWTGPRESDGSHRWFDVWDDDEPPHAARAFVYRRGFRPANGTVTWKEFAKRDNAGKLFQTWAQMPSHMLGKSALSLGLRRAFPGVIPTNLDDPDTADDDGPVEQHGEVSGPGPDQLAESPSGGPDPAPNPLPRRVCRPRSAAQLQTIRELLTEHGVKDDTVAGREMSEILGREVGPGADPLTYDEAQQVIEALTAELERPMT